MKLKIAIGVFVFALGLAAGEAQSHVKQTAWGYVWTLEPEPDFPQNNPSVQLVRCANGDLTLGPWHVLVLYDEQGSNPFGAFMQERGR